MRLTAPFVSLVALALLGSAASPAAARDGKRIFVSVDMEGIAGVVSGDQLGPQAFEYAAFRELMTQEANAAIAAAREAGASEFVVADSHGNFENLLPDKLPADVELVRGGPRPHGMVQGLDASFDGVIFVGYHASTVNPAGVRAHSFSSANLADVRVNGVSVTEGSWNAAIAAHYGVPVLAVTGDEAAVAEVQAQLPGVAGAVVKWPYAFHAARTLSPQAARTAIADAVRKGMARRGTTELPRVHTPVRLEIRFKSYRPAEALSWLPGAERADAHAVRYTVKDMPEAARFLAFVLAYQADLQP
jgi:D-amino peptidase